MASETSGNGNIRRQWIAGAITATVTVGSMVVGAIWWFSALGNSVQSLGKDQTNYQTAVNLRFNALTARVQTLEQQVHSLEVENARLEERQIEIGTQLHAIDEIGALERVDDIRFRGLLWQKVYGQPYPNPFYAPHVERDK